MEKKYIVTKKERKVSKIQDNATDETETGVRRNTVSEVIVQSSITRTEIVTESLGIEKSEDDSLVNEDKAKVNGQLKLATFQISGGDFARADEADSGTSDSSACSRITVANAVLGDVGSNYSSRNRRIYKKREIPHGDIDDKYSSALNGSHRASKFKNLKRKSSDLEDFLESVKISPEIDKEYHKANVPSSTMKMTDDFFAETEHSSCTRETKKEKDDSQTDGGTENQTDVAEDSGIDVLSRNCSTKIEDHNEVNTSSCNSSFKNELINNLKKSVADLVNYYENLQKSISEPKSTNFTPIKHDRKATRAKKIAAIDNRDPKTSEIMLTPLEPSSNKDDDTVVRPIKDYIEPLELRMLNGTASLLVANNYLKQHHAKEQEFIFSAKTPKNSRKDFRNPPSRGGKLRLTGRFTKNCCRMAASPSASIQPKQESGIFVPISVNTDNVAEGIDEKSKAISKDKILYIKKERPTFNKKASGGKGNSWSFNPFVVVLFLIVIAAPLKFFFNSLIK